MVALVVFAPAAWLANAVASATDQRLLLADARGTVWTGSAVAVLTGGVGSRDATSLPGRLGWSLHLKGLGLEVRLQHACCLNGTVALQVKPGFGRTEYTLVPPAGWVGQWPAALLGGLGTPFNTMQLGGSVRLESRSLRVESVQGRWVVDGRADFDIVEASSRLSTLQSLGTYRMSVYGDTANPGISLLSLTTGGGALQLSGSGTWGPAGVRFRGEARASAIEETALSNLLNIIGRRDGARSVISIG
ncbi:MAG: type II secretion system protein N [Rhizobiales bacterium]|nr:type II secretion system protein N [Rhizobacter sp.]